MFFVWSENNKKKKKNKIPNYNPCRLIRTNEFISFRIFFHFRRGQREPFYPLENDRVALFSGYIGGENAIIEPRMAIGQRVKRTKLNDNATRLAEAEGKRNFSGNVGNATHPPPSPPCRHCSQLRGWGSASRAFPQPRSICPSLTGKFIFTWAPIANDSIVSIEIRILTPSCISLKFQSKAFCLLKILFSSFWIWMHEFRRSLSSISPDRMNIPDSPNGNPILKKTHSIIIDIHILVYSSSVASSSNPFLFNPVIQIVPFIPRRVILKRRWRRSMNYQGEPIHGIARIKSSLDDQSLCIVGVCIL